MKKTTIMLVDDHALLRRGLADLLRYENDLIVSAEAANGAEALAKIRSKVPDVVIMDLVMPEMDGVETTRQIKANWPNTKILILTSFGTSEDVSAAIAAGATGAIVKDAPTDELLAAIRKVAGGEKVFSSCIRLRSHPGTIQLTDRQRTILQSATQGLTNAKIASENGISTDAVKQHIAAICAKLGAANRTEAVAIALRKHLLKI